MLFSGKIGYQIPPNLATICHHLSTIRHYSRLFATIRDRSPLFVLFETIRTIRTIRYSRLFATRVFQTTPLATLPVNSCCRYFHNYGEKRLQFSGNYWETLTSTEIKCIWSSCLYWSQLKYMMIPNDWSGKNFGTQISNDGSTVQ